MAEDEALSCLRRMRGWYPGTLFHVEVIESGNVRLVWWEGGPAPLDAISRLGDPLAYAGYAAVTGLSRVVFEQRLSPIVVAASYLADWATHLETCTGHDMGVYADHTPVEACGEEWFYSLLRAERSGLLEVPVVSPSPLLEVAAALLLDEANCAVLPDLLDLGHICPSPTALVVARLHDVFTNALATPQVFLEQAELLCS